MLMNKFKLACLAATASVMLSPAAFAGAFQDVVKDKNGTVWMNSHNNCVLTKWDAANNECAGQPANLRKLAKEHRTVYFDFNRSTLNAKEKAKLDALGKLIKEAKDVESVDIVGFADQIGDTGYNKRLSQRRAETVRAYLASKGLKTRKVRLEALGESKPVTNCNNANRKEQIACLAEDRRAEIEFNFVK
jgi:outer membrane protein OmpA-like peptidoglycan-associated protein